MFTLMNDELINITQLSKRINIPKRTLYRHIKDGRFPVKPVIGLYPYRWRVGDIDLWLRGEI